MNFPLLNVVKVFI